MQAAPPLITRNMKSRVSMQRWALKTGDLSLGWSFETGTTESVHLGPMYIIREPINTLFDITIYSNISL